LTLCPCCVVFVVAIILFCFIQSLAT
jgi:hypothetical protein